MKTAAKIFKSLGFTMIPVFVGLCIYDSYFNKAYLYGSAPLWLYIAERFITCGVLAGLFFVISWMLNNRDKKSNK